MAQEVMPGDIQFEPETKIIFRPPFNVQRIYTISITNTLMKRIGINGKSSDPLRLKCNPQLWILDPNESVELTLIRAPLREVVEFDWGPEEIRRKKDHLVIEWTHVPYDAPKLCRLEWFQGDGMVRQKNLPIEYHP